MFELMRGLTWGDLNGVNRLGARGDKADFSGWMQIIAGRKIQAQESEFGEKTGHRGKEKDLEQG